MRSTEMAFRLGSTEVVVFKNDDGEFVVQRELVTASDVSVIRIGMVLEREYAAYLFNKEVQRLVRQWELTVS